MISEVRGSNGSPDVLYFTDGINGETAGLFGAIAAVPEALALMLAGLGGLAFAASRRDRQQRAIV